MTTPDTSTRFPLDTVQADVDTREKNARRASSAGDVADVCFTCGRPLTAKALDNAQWVHLSTRGELIAVDATDYGSADDQGWFPLGSECAKKVPAGFKRRIGR